MKMPDYSSFYPETLDGLRDLHPIRTDCGEYHCSDSHLDPAAFRERMHLRIFRISDAFAEGRKDLQEQRELSEKYWRSKLDDLARAFGGERRLDS
jgi:hypothetical protein